MTNNDTQSNDFNDEILIRDEAGQFKILSRGDLRSYQTTLTKPITAMMDTGKEELMLQPPPPMVRKETASFYFHPEDEEEVAKVKPFQDLAGQKKYSITKILARVIEHFNVSLDEELKNRLKNIIFTYLRDRRTLVEASEALERAKTDGGLELTAEMTDKVLTFLKDIKDKIIKENGLVIEESEEKPVASRVLVSPPLPPPLKTVEPTAVPRAVLERGPALDIKPPVKITPRIKRPIQSSLARKKGKTAMTDIHKDYKLVGPVEELASLSLQTFRRLGSTIQSQAQKIIDKVSLLEEESLARKAQGIQAWRRSPLSRMYLAIGQASLEYNLSVQQVIGQYQNQGKEIMSLDEFEAISDLNKFFRF